MDKIISKASAKELNLKFYFTGKVCCRQHVSVRYVSTGRCKECKHLEAKTSTKNGFWNKFYTANKVRLNAKRKENYASVAAANRLRARIYYQNNKEKVLAYTKLYNKTIRYPKLKESGLGNFYCRKYQAKKKNAMPAWANEDKILEIYKNCPVGMEVDHIIPLQNKLVSGLHNEFNLQYLTRPENASKSNKFELVMETI